MIQRRNWLVPVLLFLSVFAVYYPGLTGGFAFDDFPNLVDNAKVHVDTLDYNDWSAAAFSSESSKLQRPIAMLTFAANYYFAGQDPVAMKATNLVIHGINAVLVYFLVRLLLALAAPQVDARRRHWATVFASAAWTLHPINLMAVLYIVQRMESLAHVFVFGGLLLYLMGRKRQLDGGSGRWFIGIGLFGGTGLGILCKESAVMLPLYAWLAEACIPALRNSPQKNDVRKLFLAVLWLPFFAGMAWLLPRVSSPVAFSTRDFTLGERLLTEGRVVIDYLRWSVLPSFRELTLFHDDYVVSRGWLTPVSTLWSMLAVFALGIGGWLLRARRPLSALGILWFLGAQALTATIVPLELMYEHRNYFASLGVCLVLADLLLLAQFGSVAMQRLTAVIAVVLFGLFAATTHFRARDWSNDLDFAASEADKRPTSPRATYGYGRMLVIASKYKADSPLTPLAIEELERARKLPGAGILPHSALLLLAAHANLPQREEWWTDMTARLRANPIGPQEINAVGSITRCARNNECAFSRAHMVSMFNAALSQPSPDMLTMAADYSMNVLKENDAALAMFRRAVEMRPQVEQYRINLAKVLIAFGHEDEARAEIAKLRENDTVGAFEADAADLEAKLQGK